TALGAPLRPLVAAEFQARAAQHAQKLAEAASTDFDALKAARFTSEAGVTGPARTRVVKLLLQHAAAATHRAQTLEAEVQRLDAKKQLDAQPQQPLESALQLLDAAAQVEPQAPPVLAARGALERLLIE